MKNLSIILAFLIVFISCKGNENKAADSTAIGSSKQENKLKRYEVKSGMIQYKMTMNGNVMGSQITGSGTESLYFKDWGNLELVEENSTTTTNTNVLGHKSTDTSITHSMSKLDNGESYHVDFDKKSIFLRRDMAMDLNKAFAGGDVNKTGKEMLEGMGGKMTGNENFLGYNCEVWDIHGAKQLMYKGAVLKLEMTMMGITTIKEATSAKFDSSVPDKYFKLPDYPIQKDTSFQTNEEFEEDMEDMEDNIEKLSKLSFEDWKKMALANDEDNEMRNMSDEELRQTYDMMQKMIKARQGK